MVAQSILKEQGVTSVGPIDGKFGHSTKRALHVFKLTSSHPATMSGQSMLIAESIDIDGCFGR